MGMPAPLYFTADIRDAAGTVIGQGFLTARVCRADWNGSGSANSADIAAFLGDWVASVQGVPPLGVADYDHDGVVTSADIGAFLAAWVGAVTGGC